MTSLSQCKYKDTELHSFAPSIIYYIAFTCSYHVHVHVAGSSEFWVSLLNWVNHCPAHFDPANSLLLNTLKIRVHCLGVEPLINEVLKKVSSGHPGQVDLSSGQVHVHVPLLSFHSDLLNGQRNLGTLSALNLKSLKEHTKTCPGQGQFWEILVLSASWNSRFFEPCKCGLHASVASLYFITLL